MAVSKIKTPKRPGPAPRTKRTNGPNPNQQHIIKVAQEHPDLSLTQIGQLCDVAHTTVMRTLARYGIDKGQVEEYKSHRADVFAGLQHRLLVSCTDDDIKKAPMGSRVLAAAQLYDKERLELDKSTSNVGVVVDLIKRLQAQEGSG